jgi:hypothetical protein
MRLRIVLALLAALLATPAPARAADPNQPPGGSVAVWAILGYGNALGVGARLRTSLVPHGFIHGSQLRDSLDLEGGLDYIDWYGYGASPYAYGYAMFLPRVGVMWNLWLTPQVALYPKFDLGFAFGTYTGRWPVAGRHDFGGLFLEGSVGVIWRVRSSLSLRGELGNQGAHLGLGFDF